jgi:maltose O-acetyltransferase
MLIKAIINRIYFSLLIKLPVSYNKFGGVAKIIRYTFAKHLVKKCGVNVNFEKGAIFGWDIEIGDNSGLGINAQLTSGVIIGKNVMMGPEVLIQTKSHNFERTDIPMNLQGSNTLKPVIIEDDVWIGQRAIILPGVKISKGSIVGAGAIVTKSFPPYSIIGGNPAKLIKSRIID